MRLIGEVNDSSNIIRDYELSCLTDEKTAVTWLYHVKDMEGMAVSSYRMTDFTNRSGEGSGSKEFGPDSTAAMMLEHLSKNNIDMIAMTGTYFSKPVIIGVNFTKINAFIVIVKREPADVEQLERSLGKLAQASLRKETEF